MLKKAIAFLSTFTLLCSLISFVPPTTMASTENAIVVSHSSPAICIDAGQEVDLSTISVQFTLGGKPVASNAITWKDGDSTITSYKPAAKGVYPLTATADSVCRTVYVVAKDPEETDYVLYENDFSTAPDLSDFRVVEQSNDTPISYDESAGTLILDASGSDANYVRVLLPSYLDNFGDAKFSARMQVTERSSVNSNGSLIFRVQNADTTAMPYIQNLVRWRIQKSTSGIRIAEYIKRDDWKLETRQQCMAPDIANGSVVDVTADFCSDILKQSVNGTNYLTAEQASAYRVGAFGLIANGCKLVVDNIKITVHPDAKLTRTLHDTRDAQSNIALGPLLVTEVDTADQIEALHTTLPTVAIFNAAIENGTLGALLDGNFTALAAVEAAMDEKVIPAYRVESEAEAEAVGAYAASLSLSDIYVVSATPSLITAARAVCDDLYGMVEVSDFNGDNEALRSSLIAAGARGVIFTAEPADRDTVSYLQDRYLTVWQTVTAQDVSAVSAINNGVLGLVTPDVQATEACFAKYYTENTLTRTPEIIGHRGVTSLAQENSIAGAIKAWEVGADMVECDIYLMADGNLVIMHDDTLDRTTTGSGNTTEQTAETIKNYEIDCNADVDPEPIPLLDDFFRELKSTGNVIVIELKSEDVAVAAPLVELINEYGMQQQVVIVSFHGEAIAAVRSADPSISAATLSTAIYADEQRSLEITQEVLKAVIPTNTAFSPSQSRGELGVNYFNDLLARGVTVWAFTADNQSDIDTLFVSGVRGITTNYSQRVANYINNFDAYADADGKITLKAITYDGRSVSTESAELVVIGGYGSYDAASGKVSLTDGSQGYFFRLTGTLATGAVYSVVTPVLSTFDTFVPDYYAATMSAETTLYYSADRTRLGGTYEAYTAPTADTPDILGGFLRIGALAENTGTGVVRVKVDQVFTFNSADQALMFYIKTPSGEGATATDITLYANAGAGQPLINNTSYYLLNKTDGSWSTKTVASNQIVLPAGFEGWVRVPYGSFNNMTATAYDQFTRFTFGNVSTGDYYIGAVSIVDNGSENFTKIKTDDMSEAVLLFPAEDEGGDDTDQPETIDYYNAKVETISSITQKAGTSQTVISDDDRALTAMLPSDWIQCTWTNLAEWKALTGPQLQINLDQTIPFAEGTALLFYVKMPENAPATELGVRIQQMNGEAKATINLKTEAFILDIRSKTKAWVNKEATAATETVLGGKLNKMVYFDIPAGFEGWVRIPQSNMNGAIATAGLLNLRLGIPGVDESYLNDTFCVGAISIVDNGALDFYKVKTNTASETTPLFYTIDMPTGITMDRVYFRGDETYRTKDNTLNPALKVTVSNIGDYDGHKLYYQYTPTGASESVKMALIRAGSPYDETATEVDRTNVSEFYIPALQGTNGAIVAGDVTEDVTVVGTSAWYSEDESGTKSYTYTNNGEDYFKIRFACRAARKTEIDGEICTLKHMAVKVTATDATGADGASNTYYIQSTLADFCTDYVDFVKVLSGPVNSKGSVVYKVNAVCTYVATADGSTHEVTSADFMSKTYNELPKLP